MKALVVYDSFYGNTEKVAQAIGAALGAPMEVVVRRVGDVAAGDLAELALLAVGSPTRAFRPTPAINHFLAGIPAGALAGVKVAAFDTRLPAEEAPSPILRFLVKLFGYAGPAIAKKLVAKGGALVLAPEGFYVTGTQGPLREGELERAAAWAQKIAASL
jgi:flavodoxin I